MNAHLRLAIAGSVLAATYAATGPAAPVAVEGRLAPPTANSPEPRYCVPMELGEPAPLPLPTEVSVRTEASVRAAKFAASLFQAMNERCGNPGAAEEFTVARHPHTPVYIKLVRDLGNAGIFTVGVTAEPGEDGIVQPHEVTAYDAEQRPAADDLTGTRTEIKASRSHPDDPDTLYHMTVTKNFRDPASDKRAIAAAHTQAGDRPLEKFTGTDQIALDIYNQATS